MSSKGKPFLYVQIQNSLYVLLCSMLLICRKLVKDLETYGFQINPYYPCVTNNMVNDEQMAVVWHVKNLKVSHLNSFKITNFVGYISIIYEGLTLNREKLHSYLVMDLDYINQMILKVYMIKYLDIMLQEFLYHLSITAATPAVDQLFKVRYDSSTQ